MSITRSMPTVEAMRGKRVPLLAAAAFVAMGLPLILSLVESPPAGAGSRSQGPITMVSANKDGTDSAPTPGGTFGAEQVSVSDDGKVVAFVSKSPAETLVNDPVQLAA